MSSDGYPFPVAVSQLDEQDSRELQNACAVKWLLEQSGGSIVVVTPQKRFEGDSLKRLIALPGTTHLSWRGFSAGALAHRRVIHAWPDRRHLNDLWGVGADALVVIEWGTEAGRLQSPLSHSWLTGLSVFSLVAVLRLCARRVAESVFVSFGFRHGVRRVTWGGPRGRGAGGAGGKDRGGWRGAGGRFPGRGAGERRR
jgi:hypothetical protein